MLAKRVIPSLRIDATGQLCDSIAFVRLDDPGDPVAAARAYAETGADELYLVAPLDADPPVDLCARVARTAALPFTVEVEADPDAVARLLQAGAARVAVGAGALEDPDLVADLARRFGGEAVGVAITARREGGYWRVRRGADGNATEWEAATWAQVAEAQGAGELIVRSSDAASGESFDLELLAELSSAVHTPIVAGGDPGGPEDVFDALMIGDADGALVGSLTHSGRESLAGIKAYLAGHGLPVRVE